MSERFFAENLSVGQQVQLAGDEARHLSTVMRASVGDTVTLFDGSGAEFTARITRQDKRGVWLEVAERHEISREHACRLTLAVALPRGERQKWLVEKLTELGVTRLVPLVTERGVALAGEAAVARLQRQVIEASKQCGRNRLMEICPPTNAVQFLQAGLPPSASLLFADPIGKLLAEVTHLRVAPFECCIAVGPEGGFTDAERAAAATGGWRFVSLGPRLLRVETAALAMASWASLIQGEDVVWQD